MAVETGAVENVVTGPDPDFWCSQRVLLTGHTGFKGTWLTLWLEKLGATVTGFSLPPETTPNLFARLGNIENFQSVIGDIRDVAAVDDVVRRAKPTIAIHMAAQPLVRRSYREPVETFATNAQGTANVLNALRQAPDIKAILVVTTDKVYRNLDDGRPFEESDHLGGHDPYSASKAAAEMATAAWAHSYFRPMGISVGSARAGNVVGGGDWSEDRLVPDLWRAAAANRAIELRYPNATRPWQHVLDPLCGYLAFAQAMARHLPGLPEALNFGPAPGAPLTVSAVADQIFQSMGHTQGWTLAAGDHPPEMKLLALNTDAARRSLGWEARLDSSQALDWTVRWFQGFDGGDDVRTLTLDQIEQYESMGHP